jgi:hypothetical protein
MSYLWHSRANAEIGMAVGMVWITAFQLLSISAFPLKWRVAAKEVLDHDEARSHPPPGALTGVPI